MNTTTNADALRAAAPMLAEADRTFALSLLAGFDKYKSFTQKQEYWVTTLIKRASGDAPAPVKADLGDMGGVLRVFETARKSGLKRPKLTITPDSGSPLQLSVAGPRGRQPGTIDVTDGGPWGANTWFGRVQVNGLFEASRAVTSEVAEAVAHVLADLARDPLAVIAHSGHKSGYCSCCGRKLDDPTSVAMGIGPVCRKRWLA